MKYRLAVLLFAVLFWPAVSHAQEYPRFEIGPMFTVTPTRDGGPMTTGFGGRLVGNVSPRIGLEFQLATYQPYRGASDQKFSGSGSFKLTFRQHSKFTGFGLGGVGFAEAEYSEQLGRGCCISRGYFPAVNLGGGFEFVPTRRLALRYDAGVSIVFLSSNTSELPSRIWNRPVLQLSTMVRF